MNQAATKAIRENLPNSARSSANQPVETTPRVIVANIKFKVTRRGLGLNCSRSKLPDAMAKRSMIRTINQLLMRL
jgi:hypothetical protein